MASAARDFYDQVIAGGVPFIDALPASADPVHENEWRDFKLYDPRREKDSRTNWSELLSAFANTEGGVVIWGVDARRDATSGIDRVSGVTAIKDAPQWAEKLRRWLLEATNPPVSGVQLQALTYPGTNDGFVVCLIPESTFKPHRAEFAENKPYRIRVADNTVVPNPALLRAMFFPQPRREIWLHAHCDGRHADPQGRTATLSIDIENRGPLSIRDLSLHATHGMARVGLDANRNAGFALVHLESTNESVWQRTAPIHPSQPCNCGFIQFSGGHALDVEFTLYQLDCVPLVVKAFLVLRYSRSDKFQFLPAVTMGEDS
jgi:hypothetical protein